MEAYGAVQPSAPPHRPSPSHPGRRQPQPYSSALVEMADRQVRRGGSPRQPCCSRRQSALQGQAGVQAGQGGPSARGLQYSVEAGGARLGPPTRVQDSLLGITYMPLPLTRRPQKQAQPQPRPAHRIPSAPAARRAASTTPAPARRPAPPARCCCLPAFLPPLPLRQPPPAP